MESSGDTENANEWELCKENVQPLRQGRKFANLSAALQPNSTDLQNKIRQQKQEFEIELRTYSGDDPLDVWYRYIKWTEQTYPKGGCGKEGNLIELLENCIQRFKDDDVYKNDFRYVNAWLKLANHQSEPLEIFSFMFNHGIGCMVSSFYSAWAWQYEESGNYKKADAIFQQGVRAGAQPMDQLKSQHLEFQARLARKVAEDGDTMMETTDSGPQRSTLAQLKGHGKHKAVGVNRLNVSTKPAQGLGVAAAPKQISGPSFSIFTEESNPCASLPPQTAEYKSIPQKAKMKAENEQKPGKWSSAKVKQKTVGTVPISEVSQHNQPAFPIHADEGIIDPPPTPRTAIRMDNNQVLSARKPQKQHNTLQAITNSAMVVNNPGEMPMYCKLKVYGGLHELQLEEIRAARWRKNRKKIEMEQRRLEDEKRRAEEMKSMMDMMKQQQEALEQQRLLFQQMHEKQWQQQQQIPPQQQQQQPQQQFQEQNDVCVDFNPPQQQQQQPQQQFQEQNDVNTLDAQLEEKLQIRDECSQDVSMSASRNTSRQLAFPNSAAAALPPKSASVSRQMFDTSSQRQCNENSFPSSIKIFEDSEPTPAQSSMKIFEDKPTPSGITIFEDNTSRVKPTQSSIKIFEDTASGMDTGARIFRDDAKLEKPQTSDTVNVFQESRAPTQPRGLQPRLFKRECTFQEQVPAPNVSAASARTPGQHEPSWPSNSFSRTRSREPTPDSFYNPFKDSGGRSRESMAAPSPTVNTREAFQLVMGMFNNTIDSNPEANFGWEGNNESVVDNQMEAEYAVESVKPKVAGGCLGTHNAQPFVIFDENQGGRHSEKVLKSHQDLIDQENRAPADYNKQPKRTGLSGILQPATDIPCQGKEDDYGDGDMFGIEPLPDEDMTFAPCFESTKKFSHLAQMVSTPFPNAGNVPLPNPALSNINVNQTQFETKTGLCAEETMFMCKSLDQEEMSSKKDMPPFAKENVYSLAEQSPKEKFPRPSIGVGQLTPIMEGSSEKSSGHSDNTNNVFCHTGFSSHHPMTGLETVDEESLRALSINESRQMNLQAMAMNESKPVCQVSVREITAPNVLAVNESRRDVSTFDVPMPEISLPAFSVNESRMNLSEYDAQEPEISFPAPQVENMNQTCHFIDITHYEPSEENTPDFLSTSVVFDSSDPFDLDLVKKFISRLPTPLSSHPNYHECKGAMPKIKISKSSCMVSIGLEEYEIVRKVGEGAFADVYLANVIDLEEATGLDLEGNECVVKAQKPACPWEFYICSELAKRMRRLQAPVDPTPFFMNIDKAYFYSDGCFFVNAYHKYGSLLNLVNAFKVKKSFLPESVVMYLTISLLKILENLMAVDIIHGDIKPDNFLFVGMPDGSSSTNPDTLLNESFPVKLIDFGRSIDMDMFPAGMTFTAKVETDGFQCIEMKTDRPWTYQTDFFGIVGTIHVLTFSNYMKVILSKDGSEKWIHSSRFRRSWKAVDLWTELNDSFLNIPNCDSLPDVRDIRMRFERYFKEHLIRNFIEKEARMVEVTLLSPP
ncbi:uncharacterized protein LOC135485367 [Lineus longissimus]|uniref:uncharacterized protein LOC135485367 n=1 Tax=Lineus longissimus TaxID=88925 RepID=UPI00315DDB6A